MVVRSLFPGLCHVSECDWLGLLAWLTWRLRIGGELLVMTMLVREEPRDVAGLEEATFDDGCGDAKRLLLGCVDESGTPFGADRRRKLLLKTLDESGAYTWEQLAIEELNEYSSENVGENSGAHHEARPTAAETRKKTHCGHAGPMKESHVASS
ncbi:hypothetical protein Scep_021245 [Stephania cephalantha]|uniref:Uncharacterized protein n=1 Tax=Stephania cephalantha TaxID=152367 RepID=A0AAP0I195_9MAGN